MATKVELNSEGVVNLLHEIGETVCAEKAREIAQRAGAESDVYRGAGRTVASAYFEGKEDGNKLLKALK